MSTKRARFENNLENSRTEEASSESGDYSDLNMFIKQEYEFQPASYETQLPLEEEDKKDTSDLLNSLVNSDTSEILSMLHAIKQQLNEVQRDVKAMKRKMSLLENQSSKVCNATSKVSSISNEQFKTVHHAINIFQDTQSTRLSDKPSDFPDILMFNDYLELCNFDRLLSNYEGPYATYFIGFIQKKLGFITEFKKFMRSGFGLLMTRELQLKCSFKGSFGHHPTANMHFLTLLQALCKTTTNATPEEIRNYCSTYFINTRGNQRKKQHKTNLQTITIIDDSSGQSDNV